MRIDGITKCEQAAVLHRVDDALAGAMGAKFVT
jgi:hypothetical protein